MARKPTRRAPSVPEVAPNIDLDTLFRRQSKARVVAERLLTGKPQTREELVDGLDLSLTTVPRVVDALATAGIQVARTTDRSRRAVFHVVGSTAAGTADHEHGPVLSRFTHTGGEELAVRVTKVEVEGGAVWCEVTSERNGRQWRARIVSGNGALNLPTELLSGSCPVLGIEMFEDDTLGWRIGDRRSSVLLTDLRGVT